MKPEQLAELVDKHIASIEAGTMTARQMTALYGNVEKQQGLDEVDRERLVGVIEQKLRTNAPAEAKKLFGPKDSEARELLSQLWTEIETVFDLSANRHQNGIKTGGSMINGSLFLDVYISFKNGDGEVASINIRQQTAASDRTVEVRRYIVGGAARFDETYPVAQYARAFEDFKQQLSEVA